MPPTETRQAIETVFRIAQARLIAGLARMVRNVALAEELAQDVLVTALAEWRKTGVPTNVNSTAIAAPSQRRYIHTAGALEPAAGVRLVANNSIVVIPCAAQRAAVHRRHGTHSSSASLGPVSAPHHSAIKFTQIAQAYVRCAAVRTG